MPSVTNQILRSALTIARRSAVGIVLAVVIGACAQPRPDGSTAAVSPLPTPTLSALFSPISAPTGQPSRATSAPIPVPTRVSEDARDQSDTAVLAEQGIVAYPVFNDTLSPDWSLQHSSQISVDPRSSDFVARGSYAIQARPEIGTGTLYFTLNTNSDRIFRREQVAALRFRLSGGRDAIDHEAMAVTIVGSNAQPYWRANDRSVQLDGRVTDDAPVFSETRLVFLGINKDIPAGEWVDVEVWLDELLFDPDYAYVTGFYLKADSEEVPTYFIDDVSLLVRTDRLAQP